MSPINSILHSGTLDVGVMKPLLQSASDCKMITKCSESKEFVETEFKNEGYGCKECGPDRLVGELTNDITEVLRKELSFATASGVTLLPAKTD